MPISKSYRLPRSQLPLGPAIQHLKLMHQPWEMGINKKTADCISCTYHYKFESLTGPSWKAVRVHWFRLPCVKMQMNGDDCAKDTLSRSNFWRKLMQHSRVEYSNTFLRILDNEHYSSEHYSYGWERIGIYKHIRLHGHGIYCISTQKIFNM